MHTWWCVIYAWHTWCFKHWRWALAHPKWPLERAETKRLERVVVGLASPWRRKHTQSNTEKMWISLNTTWITGHATNQPLDELTCKTMLETDFFTIEFVSWYVFGAYVDAVIVVRYRSLVLSLSLWSQLRSWPHLKCLFFVRCGFSFCVPRA